MKLRLLSVFLLVLCVGLVGTAAVGEAGKVGVVDERLVSQEFLIKPWAAEWQAAKIVEQFTKNGLAAEVIGADVLKDLAKLRAYHAIMIPTDQCYPDIGSRKGLISSNIRAFVKAGGVYIMPMVAAHSHWKDVDTGKVSEDMGLIRDFLGQEWVIVADPGIPGPGEIVTEAGQKCGLQLPSFPEPFSTCTRTVNPIGEVYLRNGSDRASLYTCPIGKGAVMHYAGGLPFSANVRDYVISCYSSILKTGLDKETLAKLAVEQVGKMRVYSTVPVSERKRAGSASAIRQFDLDGEWEMAEATKPFADPADAAGFDWMKVRMPNSIQAALFEAGKIENPWVADNNKRLQWISSRDWCLRKRFVIPKDWTGRQVRLRFDGIDYLGSIWLDGDFVGTHEGMLGGPTLDITEDAAPGTEHELVVRIAAGKGRSGDVIKPDILCAMSYWGNKYWSMGLWRSVRVIGTGDAYMEAPLVRTDAISTNSAKLWAQVSITNAVGQFQGIVSARIVDPENKVVWRKDYRQKILAGGSYWEQAITLDAPKLWWPNGMGDQPLYRMELSIRRDEPASPELDAISTRFGIRTIEVRRNPSFAQSPRRVRPLVSTVNDGQVIDWAWENGDESYRFLFVVNDRPFYAKGVSWLTSDDLLMLTPERESWMVGAAKSAGVNLFRLNAGTDIFETEQFYNLCDEQGILVWQELIFNWDGGHMSSIPTWRDQLTQSVLRIRQHPSLAIYCFGNEFNPYGLGLGPYLGCAREIFDTYDNRPMRMSSPGCDRVGSTGGGTFHAYDIPNIWTGDPNWYPRVWDEGANFISEWSIYAYNNYSCLKRIIPKDELERGPVGYDFETFKNERPIMNVDRYAEPGLVAFNFMKSSWYGDLAKASVADLTEYSQMGHAQTVGYVMEHWRSQFPYKGGQTFWTYNIPQPASSWNLIDWFGQPLMAFYSMKRANEPVHVLANTTWFFWGPGDTFKASVWALNDAAAPMTGARITARVLDRTFREAGKWTWTTTVPGGGNKGKAKEISWPIPADTPDSYFWLEVTLTDAKGKRLSQQVYWMKALRSLADPEARKAWQAKPSTDPICKNGPWLRPQVESVATSLDAKVVRIKQTGAEASVVLRVANTGKAPAFPVRIGVQPDAYTNIWSDNFFWLAPGESREITGRIKLDMNGLDPVTKPAVASLSDITVGVSAWNAPVRSLRAEALK